MKTVGFNTMENVFYLSDRTAGENPAAPGEMPNRYHMEAPVELLQITMRPSPEGGIFLITQIGPTGVHYISLPAAEFGTHVQHTGSGLLHTHDYSELLCVVDGEIFQNISNDRHFYPGGSCCIVSPDVLHSEEYQAQMSVRLYFLKFGKAFREALLSAPLYFAEEETEAARRCLEYLEGRTTFLDFIPREGARETLHPLFDELAAEMLSPGPATTLSVMAAVSRILLLLFDGKRYSNTPVPPGTRAEQRLFEEIRTYMEQNPERVTRADLERRFHYSGDDLYKVIRRRTGLSIHEVATEICMRRAADLLEHTDLRIEEAAGLAGCKNLTRFYRDFRSFYGMTPAHYRKSRGSSTRRDGASGGR